MYVQYKPGSYAGEPDKVAPSGRKLTTASLVGVTAAHFHLTYPEHKFYIGAGIRRSGLRYEPQDSIS